MERRSRKKEIRVRIQTRPKRTVGRDGAELSYSGGQRILDPRAKDCSGFVTAAIR